MVAEPGVINTSSGAATVKVAVSVFDVSAVAVTVMVYVAATVGVQVRVVPFPLAGQPAPVVGVVDTVKFWLLVPVNVKLNVWESFAAMAGGVFGLMAIPTTGTGAALTVKVAVSVFDV